MSPRRSDLASTSPAQENTRCSEALSASRWAPGGLEDQILASQKVANEQAPKDKATTPTAKGISSSRWATDPAEHDQTENKKVTNAILKKSNKNHPTSKPSQQRLDTDKNVDTDNILPSTPTQATFSQRRIIGPLTEEEKTVKMENPFFNPEKDKGLSSSRWANQ